MVEPKLDPGIIQDVTDLLVAAIHIDRYLMMALDRLDEEFDEIHALTLSMFKQISKNKHELNNKILRDNKEPDEKVSRHLEEITAYNLRMEEEVETSRARLQRLCACCDRCFAFYDAIVKSTSDEAVKSAAQKLASFAFDRNKVLRVALAE